MATNWDYSTDASDVNPFRANRINTPDKDEEEYIPNEMARIPPLPKTDTFEYLEGAISGVEKIKYSGTKLFKEPSQYVGSVLNAKHAVLFAHAPQMLELIKEAADGLPKNLRAHHRHSKE